MHSEIERQFKEHSISVEGIQDLLHALDVVWKQKEGEAELEANRLRHKIKFINEAIDQQVEAATNPEHAPIRQNILSAIAKKKDEIGELESQLEGLEAKADSDKQEFVKFALEFVKDMGSRFLELSQENRLRCKQVIFPSGFYLDENKKVYTPEISPLITLVTKKKDAEASENSHLVRVMRL